MVKTIQDPFIVKNVFDQYYFRALQKYAINLWINNEGSAYSDGFGRYQWANTEVLNEGANLLLPMAKEKFKSETLKPSWNLLVIYETEKARLWKHKDDNACEYTIDYCLFQKQPWDLWVENKPYRLKENEALFMYGNAQEHWREDFPEPETNMVAYAFYFYCEPDHWYFKYGPSYLDTVIRVKKN
jgi:hypothetical protein